MVFERSLRLSLLCGLELYFHLSSFSCSVFAEQKRWRGIRTHGAPEATPVFKTGRVVTQTLKKTGGYEIDAKNWASHWALLLEKHPELSELFAVA